MIGRVCLLFELCFIMRESWHMACIGYGNSVCLSVRPSVLVSQPVTVSRPGEIETSGFHHMIALVSSIL